MTAASSVAPSPDAADPGPRMPPWLRHPVGRVLLIVVLFVVIQAAAVGSAYAVGGISPLLGGVVGAAVALGVYASAVRLVEQDQRGAGELGQPGVGGDAAHAASPPALGGRGGAPRRDPLT